jgi:hypothetical protein
MSYFNSGPCWKPQMATTLRCFPETLVFGALQQPCLRPGYLCLLVYQNPFLNQCLTMCRTH